MPEGAAELTIPRDSATVFAFLADPRNAQAWFTGADFTAPPEGAPRVGMAWTLAKSEETRGPMPTRMRLYEPASRFAWETTRGPMKTNWIWTVSCAPARDEHGAPATRVRLAIRLRPGLLDTLLALILARTLRQTLSTRAARTLERASAALASRRGTPRGGSFSAASGSSSAAQPRRRKRR